jgi:2-dehydropantoate 2-reductase
MRIGVMAAGAIGGYYGAQLAAAGHDVVFFARGAHLEALRENGLKLKSTRGNLHLVKVCVTDNPASVAPLDTVLFAVKLWDTEKAAREIKPVVGRETLVISLQNGVGSVEVLQSQLDSHHIMAGSAYAGVNISAPGVIEQTTSSANIICGSLSCRPDQGLEAFANVARAAGIDLEISEDMNRDLWQKFVFIVGLSGVAASTRQSLGQIFHNSDTRNLFLDLMRETVAVGRAKGVSLAPDLADRHLEFARTFPPSHKGSTLNDLERGNRLEVDWLAGHVIDLGRALDIPTPANDAVYAVLKLHRMGAGPLC